MAFPCALSLCCLTLAMLNSEVIGIHMRNEDDQNFMRFGGKIVKLHHQLLQRLDASKEKRELGLMDTASISVHLDEYTNEVSDQFLSVTLDAGGIRYNWQEINLTSARILNMAKALHPAMLRVGGTAGDFIIFQEQSHSNESSNSLRSKSGGCLSDVTGRPAQCAFQSDETNFTMNASQWDTVNDFVRAVGWDLIFGLNALLRKPWPNGNWDSYNAEQLMAYTASKGYTVNWELGNEPDHFSRVAPNIPVSPQQDVRDFRTLKTLVAEKSPSTKFIAGPDVANIHHYYDVFIETIGDDVINAATWHHYYCDGHTAVLPDFTRVKLLDSFIEECHNAGRYIQKHLPDVELWLGETSSCYGGGAPVLSSAYVAGFMWLDKLGIAALTNHTRVFRQALIGAYYSLLNSTQYPNPDYWLSVLYKKLVGTRVLYVLNALEKGRYIRAYAHCAKTPYPSGSVVLLLLNLHTFDANATLANEELVSSSRDVYWLTPPGSITSRQVTLNGHLLQLVNGQLPDLEPQVQEARDSIFLPALSFGFYIFKDVKASACV